MFVTVGDKKSEASNELEVIDEFFSVKNAEAGKNFVSPSNVDIDVLHIQKKEI